jgi:hypothetical protein
MAATLPAPDVVLSERLLVCEAHLHDAGTAQADVDHASLDGTGSVCGVLQAAASKAVGCAVAGQAVVEGESVDGAVRCVQC